MSAKDARVRVVVADDHPFFRDGVTRGLNQDGRVEVVAEAENGRDAIEAIRRAGLTPVRSSIRGGTDGSRLSFMGLPCPNIFAGEHAFHSRLEWVSRQDMEKAAETIVHLAMIWEERA